ncbi:hypothetical protein ACJJIR_14405 [Microbulbifer sp. SSSA008]|uniref:hypothetical protein n=1 Tax=unclassified Microbulbifer TaxID=2619833 RepID=UPI0024AD6008|nr:hypothetical protein [Microbulbifer sp. VAAF005]WHI47961.1 hypothetical protein P0078_06140 [Microbulbifer sp. VAAF005]
MRSLPFLIAFALFSTSVFAHDNHQTAEEVRQLKKEVVKLRKEVHSDHKQGVGAENVRDLEKEVVKLRKNVHRLQDLILELQASIDAQPELVPPALVEERPKWACYMKDPVAGGMHSNGFSRIEAKGKLLELCTQRSGFCSESRIKCSE